MRHGFTLLETVIALAVFMLVSASAVQLLGYVSSVTDRLWTRGELLENARIATDVLSVHIRSADTISILAKNGTVSQLTVTSDNSGVKSTHIFSHHSNIESAKHQRLEFGGNELASHISEIKCKLEGDILSLTIITSTRAGEKSKKDAEPVRLTTKIKIYNEITIRDTI